MSAVLSEPLSERVRARISELELPARLSAWLGDAGVEAWIVGGFIRDVALGGEPYDLDVAVTGDSLAIAERLASAFGGRLVPLDPERGVARIVFNALAVDISPARGGILADLGERDFTINALAVPFSGQPGPLIDPNDGVGDLRRCRVRLVSGHVFRDDGLRLLRAVRIASEYDLTLDPDLLARARADAGCIDGVSPERTRDELLRLLSTDSAARGIRALDGMKVLGRLFPRLAAARGISQPREHYYDVFEHSIETVAALDVLLAERPAPGRAAERLRMEFRQRLDAIVDISAYFGQEIVAGRSRGALTKLAALLHDIGKPETKAPDNTGRIRFLGHSELGERYAAEIMAGLRFSNREARFVRTMVREHLRPMQLSNGGPPTDRALSRYFRDLDDAAIATLVLSLADHMAARGPLLDAGDYAAHVVYLGYVLDRRRAMLAVTPRTRLLTGDDVMAALGLAPGPLVGRALHAVEAAQSAGELLTRDEALAVAREALAAGSPETGKE